MCLPLCCLVQVPDRHFFLVAMSDTERNEWVAAIGRATTESRRVRSYSEEVEYQEQQVSLAIEDDEGARTERIAVDWRALLHILAG